METLRQMVMPLKYIQGPGVLKLLGDRAMAFGDSAFVIGESVALSLAGPGVRDSLESAKIKIPLWDDKVSECTYAGIDRLVSMAKDSHVNLIVGVGGGKAVDTAKAVADRLRLPVCTVGTQCATNADASSESVIYSENHEYIESIKLRSNPALVVEDTEILASAPVKYIIQGMGDALSCRFEAQAFAKLQEIRGGGSVPLRATLALAESCYRTLMGSGVKAVEDLKSGVRSRDVEDIVEAVKFTSSVSFENSSCAMAHAVHNGFTTIKGIKGAHGEIVAYGTIVQCMYEKRPVAEVKAVYEWCRRLGLPTSLKMIGSPSREAVVTAAKNACADSDMNCMPELVEPEALLAAIDAVEKGI